MGRREDVVGGHHQDPGLCLCLYRKRQVDRHLVTVKVGVVGNTYQGMEPDCLSFHQHRLKCLDSKPVEGGGTVEQNTVLLDHLVKGIPHLGKLLFNHLLGALDGGSKFLLFKFVVNKGLEQLQGHLLWKPALLEFQVRTNYDNRTAGVIHTLSKEILTESALLSL